MLGELTDSLREKGLTFAWDEKLVDYVTAKSYSLTYGARNLRRVLQKEIEDPLAGRIIGEYEHPFTGINATVEDGKVVLYTM